MTVPRPRAPRHDDAGFTLIELLTTMVIATIVLFAILSSAEFFATASKRATDNTDAQQAARSQVNQMVSFLRQGRVATGQTTPIPATYAASRSDLVVAAYVTSGTVAQPGDVAGWVRYCTTTVNGRSSLVVGVRAGDAYAAPGACAVANTTNAWHHVLVADRTLLNPTQLFDFTRVSGTPCSGATCLPAAVDIATVGIRLALANSPTSTTQAALIRDAVSFRNRS